MRKWNITLQDASLSGSCPSDNSTGSVSGERTQLHWRSCLHPQTRVHRALWLPSDSMGGTLWKVRIVVQSLSHVWLFVTPPMNCNTPGSPVLHDFLPEFAQVHVHWVHWWCYLTILSSAALSSFCLQYFPAFQGLFQWVSSSRQVAKSED